MSEHEQSPWARPADKEPVSAQQIFEQAYSDRYDPDDIDDMVFFSSELPAVNYAEAEPTPESSEALLDQAIAQQVGGAVLESAGVAAVDDSIDENVHRYKLSDLRAMRNEARRRYEQESTELTQESLVSMMGTPEASETPVEAVIPNLEEVMSGEVDPMSLVDEAQAELALLQKGLEQSDITALWMYAHAVHDAEIINAENRMSDAVKQGDLRFKYKAVSKKLYDARVKAGIL